MLAVYGTVGLPEGNNIFAGESLESLYLRTFFSLANSGLLPNHPDKDLPRRTS